MMYRLFRELADDGVHIAATCRVFRIARQLYSRWLTQPVSDLLVVHVHFTNAAFGAHRDDPELGYWFLADEARQAGQAVCERTVWQVSRQPLVVGVRQTHTGQGFQARRTRA